MERKDKEQRIDSRLRVIGFVLGIAIAASIVTESRIPAGAGVLGADAHIVVAPSGELAVKPSGLVLEGTGLTPASEPATGSFQVMNQTGSVLDVRLHGIPDARRPRSHVVDLGDRAGRRDDLPRLARRLPRLDHVELHAAPRRVAHAAASRRGSPVTRARATSATWRRSTWGSARP